MGRVVRTRRRLGVVLDTEGLERRVAEPLGGAVVEVVLDRLPFLREGFGNDDEPVVLGGDLDPAAPAVLHRLVDPVVAELQLLRPSPDRLPQDLVAQADAEDRDLPQDRPDRLHDVGEGRRIAGAVGEQDPVGLKGEDLLSRRRRRQDEDLAAPPLQIPEDVVLDAAVQDDDPPLARGAASRSASGIVPGRTVLASGRAPGRSPP